MEKLGVGVRYLGYFSISLDKITLNTQILNWKVKVLNFSLLSLSNETIPQTKYFFSLKYLVSV